MAWLALFSWRVGAETAAACLRRAHQKCRGSRVGVGRWMEGKRKKQITTVTGEATAIRPALPALNLADASDVMSLDILKHPSLQPAPLSHHLITY